MSSMGIPSGALPSRHREPESGIGDELPDFGQVVLGHVDQVAGPEVGVFTQIFIGEHMLNVDPSCFGPATWSSAEKDDFGVLGFVGEPARNGNRLGHGRISAQFVLALTAEFAA